MKAKVTIKKELQLLKRKREKIARRCDCLCPECETPGEKAALLKAEQEVLALMQALEWVLHDGGLMRPLSYTKVKGV